MYIYAMSMKTQSISSFMKNEQAADFLQTDCDILHLLFRGVTYVLKSQLEQIAFKKPNKSYILSRVSSFSTL